MHAPVGLLGVGLALGVATWVAGERSPQFSLAASAPEGSVVLIVTAWLCVLAAAAHLSWGSGRRSAAALLGVTGLAWLAPAWETPDAPSVAFGAALLLRHAAPALLVHAALAWPTGRLERPASRVVVAIGYVVCVVGAGLAPALLLDPEALGCTDCATNPWSVVPQADAATLAAVEDASGIAVAGWLVVAVVALVLARRSDGDRAADSAVRAPTVVFLVTVMAGEVAAVLGLPRLDPVAATLWLTASLALAACAVGALWELAMLRRARRSVHRIVLGLSGDNRPGRLRDVFAARLGDPSVELLYVLNDGSHVDREGWPVAPGEDRTLAPVLIDGAPLAVVVHAPRAPAAPEVLASLTRQTRLGLEHEALTARALAEERTLRRSGVRLLAARDAERRRLERDLHDGAQQRLVGIALGLQLLARSCTDRAVTQARHELALLVAEIRATAQGLAPPVLVDAGVSAAVRSLAETRALVVGRTTDDRLDPVVETTLYQLVEQATRRSAGRVDIAVADSDVRACVRVDGGAPDLAEVADRVVTLGGLMSTRSDGEATRFEVTLPLPGPADSPGPGCRLG
ncbi:sensor histidine kinase [Mumia sp. DW29H23]|uniref:sensor histidine kinase n=1 Tax=Mumia sp. DW29H23 TaxID=3421241 RepID=UPI003D6861C2